MTVYNDQMSLYINHLFVDQDTALQLAWEDTPKRGLPAISVKPEEGLFLQILVRASNARKVVEIGTLGGYSGIWIARGLPDGAQLITVEAEPRHAEVAHEHFIAAGVQDKVDQRIGKAPEILDSISIEGPFDFIFIDADKTGYPAYFNWALENLRIGGVIAAHNAFRNGAVLGTPGNGHITEEMHQFNRKVAAEPRVISTIFPAGDGTLVAVKVA